MTIEALDILKDKYGEDLIWYKVMSADTIMAYHNAFNKDNDNKIYCSKTLFMYEKETVHNKATLSLVNTICGEVPKSIAFVTKLKINNENTNTTQPELQQILDAYKNFEDCTHRVPTQEEMSLIRFGYTRALLDLSTKSPFKPQNQKLVVNTNSDIELLTATARIDFSPQCSTGATAKFLLNEPYDCVKSQNGDIVVVDESHNYYKLDLSYDLGYFIFSPRQLCNKKPFRESKECVKTTTKVK